MMTIGLIALDLDGTLLDSQKNLSERNRRALERCARMGIQIVPTTGRRYLRNAGNVLFLWKKK